MAILLPLLPHPFLMSLYCQPSETAYADGIVFKIREISRVACSIEDRGARLRPALQAGGLKGTDSARGMHGMGARTGGLYRRRSGPTAPLTLPAHTST